ncbi:MAG: hypothetical protein QOE90_2945 [Thermoplasmata archaeon]|nr:hypothetical protein [Thermoplasmata archaeon]
MSTQDARTGAADHARLTGFMHRMRADQRTGFLALRALALSLGPDVVERVDGTEVTYMRRARPFVGVRTGRGAPTLVFPPGLPLEDPMGRLLRHGDERYVSLDTAEALDAHVQEFVRKAYALLPRA